MLDVRDFVPYFALPYKPTLVLTTSVRIFAPIRALSRLKLASSSLYIEQYTHGSTFVQPAHDQCISSPPHHAYVITITLVSGVTAYISAHIHHLALYYPFTTCTSLQSLFLTGSLYACLALTSDCVKFTSCVPMSAEHYAPFSTLPSSFPFRIGSCRRAVHRPTLDTRLRTNSANSIALHWFSLVFANTHSIPSLHLLLSRPYVQFFP